MNMKTVFYNGNIYTGLNHVSAFVLEDNKFIYVGNDKEALDLADSNDNKYNLNGTFVCAGFNDSHMHLLSLGRSLGVARLNQHTSSKKDMYEYLKEYVSTYGEYKVKRNYSDLEEPYNILDLFNSIFG